MHYNQITKILESTSTEISDCYATLQPDAGNTEIHGRIKNDAETRSSKPQLFF